MNCWFCGVRNDEESHQLEIEMYGDVVALKSTDQTKVAYKVSHIRIPRCADCHSRHSIAGLTGILTLVLSLSLLLSVLFAAFGWIAVWGWALWMGLSFGLLLGLLFARFIALKGIYSVHDAKSIYPAVKDALEKCYRFGKHPKGQVVESDKPCDAESKTQAPAP